MAGAVISDEGEEDKEKRKRGKKARVRAGPHIKCPFVEIEFLLRKLTRRSMCLPTHRVCMYVCAYSINLEVPLES